MSWGDGWMGMLMQSFAGRLPPTKTRWAFGARDRGVENEGEGSSQHSSRFGTQYKRCASYQSATIDVRYEIDSFLLLVSAALVACLPLPCRLYLYHLPVLDDLQVTEYRA